MNKQEAIQFAQRSASAAVDQAGTFGGLQNSIETYRENVRDTLNDEGASEHETAAFEAFDIRISQLCKA